jgi:uncharacterized protein (TIGR02271 family)
MATNDKTVVALYDDSASARTVIEQLEAAGIPRVSISTMGSGLETVSNTLGGTDRVVELTRLGVPENDAELYAEGVRRGGTLVISRLTDAQIDPAITVLEGHAPVDIDHRGTAYRESGWSGHGRTLTDFDEASAAEERARYASTTRSNAGTGLGIAASELRDVDTGREEHIPIFEEELRVGKRAVKRGGVRVRSYVVETPVQEQVVLRDETIRVERRDIDPDRPATDTDFQERTIEVSEVDEEAVVAKHAQIVEEVVVSKDVEERTQTISDSVRSTRVEVEDTRSTNPVTDKAAVKRG